MSWVVKEKVTGKVIFETFDGQVVAFLNTTKYEAIPILEYLQSINGKFNACHQDGEIKGD